MSRGRVKVKGRNKVDDMRARYMAKFMNDIPVSLHGFAVRYHMLTFGLRVWNAAKRESRSPATRAGKGSK